TSRVRSCRSGRGEHGERVHNPMPARDREGEAQNATGKCRLDCRAAWPEHAIEEPNRSFGMGSKIDHFGRAGSDRARCQVREIRVVSIEHSNAAGFEPEKYFGLGIGDRLE